ncbi:CHAT domain-containing protein [Luteolibacter pohnpeiensis]|uniref:CHAT domain-containing protein n=1 Tax=Luteolibacter pohnpeiensis TaxID=454153 RepID=A0A934SA89_9BACT|nr:CHAT domain-containing protein [Luteolibacter pohnpeiensis]MBK1884144.1 CHAT domain-containing protein [Luteolibacter pohnpeiensis]
MTEDERIKAGLILQQKAEDRLDAAEQTNNPKPLAQSLDFADRGLEILQKLSSPPTPQVEAIRRFLWCVRGRARLLEFQIHATSSSLDQAVEDLREANKPIGADDDPVLRARFEEYLIIALLSQGEHYSDCAPLREASRRALNRMECNSAVDLKSSKYRMFNAHCLANLRIGTYTSDRGLVEKTARQLRNFLSRDDLEPLAQDMISKSVIMALFEYAKLKDKKGVFESLLEMSSIYIGEDLPDQHFYFYYRGAIKVELYDLGGDADLLKSGIKDIEAIFAIPDLGLNSRLSGMQVISQAFFRLGKALVSKSHLEKSIGYLDGILKIIGSAEGDRNTMIPRTLTSIASAKHTIGMMEGNPILLEEAEAQYINGLSRVLAESAPALYSQLATGLFLVRYHQKKWEAAVETFARLEYAWSIVMADKKVTSEIHAQRARDMAGSYSRAAYCLLQLGFISEAFFLIDHGRGQSLRAANAFAGTDFSQLDDEVRKRLKERQIDWQQAQRSGDAEECRYRLRLYLDILREAGLDELSRPKTVRDLEGILSSGGVLILIFSADKWVKAVIVSGGAPVFHEVPLAEDAAAKIGTLIHGTPLDDCLGWADSYHHFVGSSNANGPYDPDALACFENWTKVVNAARVTLGGCLMEPIRNELMKIGIKEGSPVVLLPPGELAALPLSNAEVRGNRCFADLWPTSSIPCLDLLRSSSSQQTDLKILVVGPHCPDEEVTDSVLHFAMREREVISRQFSGDHLVTLKGQAGVESVLDSIPRSSIVHFACHGNYNWDNVQNSCVHLPDGTDLSLGALRPTIDSLFNTRLVMLSCCETGISGVSVPPDEFEGILPAFLHCGVRAAIGSLWAVYDDAAMLTSYRFYHEFLDEKGREKCPPSHALAKAASWLRQVTLGELVDLRLLTPEEAVGLVESRFGQIRLRTGYKSKRVGKILKSGRRGPARLDPELRGVMPYTSPVDWGAFVLIGY